MIRDNSDEHRSGREGHPAARLPSPVIMVAKPNRPQEEEQQKHYLAALLSALRRGWRIAVPLGIGLSVVGAFAGWKLFVPKFSASSYLRIDADDRPLIFQTADEASGAGRDFKLYKNTHQQLLVTPFVLNAALGDPKVSALPEIKEQEDAINWLQTNLKVNFPGDGEIMKISMETASPSACVPIVNGVVDAFMQEVVVNDRNDRLSRLNNLERVYSEAESKVRNKRGELKSLASALGTSDSESLTVAQQSAIQQYGKMTELLSQIQFSLMQAEGELKIAEEFERRQKEADAQLATDDGSPALPEPDTAAMLAVAERTPDVIRLEEQIASAKSKLSSWSSEFGATHPSVRKLKEEIASMDQLLVLRKSEASQRAKLSVGEQNAKQNGQQKVLRTPAGVTYDLAAMATRTQILANQEKILAEKVAKLLEETKQLSLSSIDVELMRTEISGLEDVLRRVGEEIERTSIELKTASRIKLLSPAVSALGTDPKKRLTRALGLGFLGLVAPFGLLIFWDLSRKRVNNREGTSDALSLPTIGTIPRIARHPRQPELLFQVGTERARSELDESLDDLASMLLHSSQSGNRQVLMISSAMPGEGKSTVACQLAQGLARAGKTVALVDFDLRRPSLHRYLKLPLEPGVAECLSGNHPFEEACQKTEIANLSVMTAGDWKGNLHERCTSGTVDELFSFLRASFDLVVIDSSPILPVHDSRIIGKFTDGVVLTLVRDRSRLPEAAQACEILKSYGVPVLGTVIIGVSSRAYPGYYPMPPKDSKPKRLMKTN